MENYWIYVVDERWETDDLPFRDVRGALHALPLRLDVHGKLMMAQPPKGTMVIAGTLRVVLGTLKFIPVQLDPMPALDLGGTVRSGSCSGLLPSPRPLPASSAIVLQSLLCEPPERAACTVASLSRSSIHRASPFLFPQTERRHVPLCCL